GCRRLRAQLLPRYVHPGRTVEVLHGVGRRLAVGVPARAERLVAVEVQLHIVELDLLAEVDLQPVLSIGRAQVTPDRIRADVRSGHYGQPDDREAVHRVGRVGRLRGRTGRGERCGGGGPEREVHQRPTAVAVRARHADAGLLEAVDQTRVAGEVDRARGRQVPGGVLGDRGTRTVEHLDRTAAGVPRHMGQVV